jgi:predicted DsbA family dithiol-disulfide isomerase
MPPSFFVDVWGDVVCPFCYLGSRQLDIALARFEHADDIDVRHHAFELDPHAARDFGGTLDQMLADKYGLPLERAAALNGRVEESARALGMTWSLDRARPTNTFDAHRVIALAATHGLAQPMLNRLSRAYFSDGLLISDHPTLSSLAAEVGVPGVPEMLRGTDFTDIVRHDENLAARIGITGVPAFVIDGQHRVSGAQGADALYDALVTAWSTRVDA